VSAKAKRQVRDKVQLTYTPTGGTANTLTKSYTLVLK